MKLMGVTEECELYHMVEELYYRIKNEMLEVHEAYKSKYYRDSYETFREFITDQFSDEVYQKVLDVEENNWTVYIGKLNSDEEPFISFVCCDCFVEETDKIYFNYTNCSW
ncbi:MAG: hypothetical protein HWN69_03045 [Desulfobacterales bacterium]|nr:hypothetical protein [Desulfobacterales bacterium]